MKNVIDLTAYPVKTQIQLIKANGKVPQRIPAADTWEEVEQLMDSVAIVSNEVKDYFKQKFSK